MRSSCRARRCPGFFCVVAFALAASLAPFASRAQTVEGGRFGRALKIGEGAYAAADYSPVYFLEPLTVECWAKLPSATPGAKPAGPNVLAASEPRHSAHHWEIYCDAAGAFCAAFPGYAGGQVKSDARIGDGQWHYLAVVFDGQSVQLWADGKQAAKQAVRKTGPYPDTGPLTFGAMEGVAPVPGTLIDEVRISRVARPVDRAPDAPFAPDADTAGLWHFDEDAKAYDKTGFADASATRNPARLELLTRDAPLPPGTGGFDATRGPRTRWADMDYGAFFSSTLGLGDKANVTPKAISIRVGPGGKHAVAFDTDLLRYAGGWGGDFVKIYKGREGLAQHPDAGGEAAFSTRPGPGWTVGRGEPAGNWADPRPDKLGPLPRFRAHYRGLYVHGQDVVLSYTVGGAAVLDLPGLESAEGADAFTRTLEVGPSNDVLTALVADVPGAESATPGDAGGARGASRAALTKAGRLTCAALVGGGGSGATLQAAAGRILLTLPAHAEAARYKLAVWAGPAEDAAKFDKLLAASAPPADLQPLTQGGPPRFPDPVITRGELGKPEARPDGRNDGAYVVDTLTAPDDNPWKSFLRFGGLDFFSNGDAAVCSVSGDVWVVSGIDDSLQNLRWRRFATGLFQPLGLKIVDDKVYVLGRDQITRLHDLNGDGEADFYENFNNDCKVTPGNGHAYTTCLETDREGNFYYCKCGDSTSHGGSVLRVSKDGGTLDVFATGVRNSNGLGADRYGQISEADNEGEWVPASRIDLVRRGTFLGYTPMAHADAPPKSPGQPIVWMPQDVDNSSGGQAWVAGDKWGLPEGEMLHTSYGAAALLHVMTEEVDGVTQGAVWRFPFRFATGVMRGRFRPQDGQLYLCGLRGWQTAGARDGALQRVRYTGGPVHQPAAWHARANGILLSFTCPLEKASAEDADSWEVLQWNYKWSSAYGSPHLSVRDPRKHGYDLLAVKSARLLKDGKTVFLELPDLRPAMTTKVGYNLSAADGVPMKQDVHCTIHALGPAFGGEEGGGAGR